MWFVGCLAGFAGSFTAYKIKQENIDSEISNDVFLALKKRTRNDSRIMKKQDAMTARARALHLACIRISELWGAELFGRCPIDGTLARLPGRWCEGATPRSGVCIFQ